MVKKTRKLMTMYKALHPKDDVDILNVSRKEGGRGLTSTEDSVDASIQRLEYYIQKREERLITATRNNTDKTRTNRKTWEEKQLDRRFKRRINISHEKTWTWLRKGNLKTGTVSSTKQRHKNQSYQSKKR